MEVIEQERIRRRFSQAVNTYDDHAEAEQLPSFTKERENLLAYSRLLAEALTSKGGEISQSHIIPFIVGESEDCVRKAEELQRKGFYCLPVRPPTVPKGTSRIRFSLTANLTDRKSTRLNSSHT